VQYYGGGTINHSFYWKVMKTDNAAKPQGALAKKINADFGSLEKLKEQFFDAAKGIRGSGWAWLVLDSSDALRIVTTENHDNPISDGQVPLLVIDIWEHAYYLKYTYKKGDYIKNWWSIVNWSYVSTLYDRIVAEKRSDALEKWDYIFNNVAY
jgi:Fe-Mn family superoxide dismutase